MRARLVASVLGFAILVSAVPVRAHHSFAAEFDADKPLRLTGAVTKVEWTNPHVWFYIDVKNDAGEVVNWAMEMGSPNGLLRAGWTRNSLKLQDVVMVEGFASRDKRNTANASVVILANTGQKLFAGSSGPTR
jgi:Family of unknown function (DUF6152)